MNKNIWNASFSVAVFAAVLFSGVFLALGQYRTDAYAITNARIVTGTGSLIEKGTVVIRDGLIAQIGENVTVPADAKVVDGTGLTIYPGFFDANSNVGFAAPALTQARGFGGGGGGGGFPQPAAAAQTQPQSNSNFPVGLRPETQAAEMINGSDAGFEASRNAGITTALSVPRDGIFMGESALVDTAGDDVAAMIVRAPFAEHVAFRTLGGGRTYPVSLMGTFSALRQMLLDAQRLQEIKRMYATNPRGMHRPEADRSLEALIPVLNREMPLVINASSEREIIRALDLGKEFNVKLIVAGGLEAGKVADRLKKQDVPVLLSLNFPKRTTAAAAEADPESMETLRLRAYAPKNAAILASAGVKFAFQSGGMTSMTDFLSNAGKTVESGLAKDAAIRALTMSPAEIFGVSDRLGSLEAGKIANLVMVRGDVFAKERQITHVFVDGVMFEPKAPERPAGGRPGGGRQGGQGGQSAAPPTSVGAVANVAGTWKVTIQMQEREIAGTFNFTQEGSKLTGAVQTPLGNSEIKNGEATADGYHFEITVTMREQSVNMTFTGKVSGDQTTGTVTGAQGTVPFSGTKNP
jgi:imidazolonepropionase-like amidohydrolase